MRNGLDGDRDLPIFVHRPLCSTINKQRWDSTVIKGYSDRIIYRRMLTTYEAPDLQLRVRCIDCPYS